MNLTSSTFLPSDTFHFNNVSSTNSTLNTINNASLYSNGTLSAEELEKRRALALFLKVAYVIGILGNTAALITLRVGERRVRNRKHLLLLTALAVNDLVALVGMMSTMVVAEHVPGAATSRYTCMARVVLRTFGIGSVCIAVTMALERYLALTRPFFYQKQVTYYMIRMALVASWVLAAVLTCAPIFGLGRYYDDTGPQPKCMRYREAVSTTDFVYAIVYVIFGTCLCLVLVYCNLAVIRALYAITAPRAGGPVVRRVSKSSQRRRERCLSAGSDQPLHNAATAEEVAFSRLMATLSVLFMICWLPQMVMSAVHLSVEPKRWKDLRGPSFASDMLMLMNYVLDPLLYVLLRRRWQLASLSHTIATCFKRGHKTSTESMSIKTSCCPQDTLVVSDSSAELRPLRTMPLAHSPAHPAATATLLRLDH